MSSTEPETTDAPECLDCGACCFSDYPYAIRVWGDDHARLGDRADDLTVFHGHRCYMRLEGGHCAALRVEGARFACDVYELRPAVCRDLARGSGQCRAERHAKRERTLVAAGSLVRRA